MIQPPKLNQLVANYLSEVDSSVEEWLQASKLGKRVAAPSPAPPKLIQDHECSSSGIYDHQIVPQTEEEPEEHKIHPDTCTTPVPACDELFFADFDLPSFSPSEIWVTVDEDALVVEGEHRELCNDFYECHEYFRKVPLPAEVDTDQLKCTLHRDGHLFVEAPLVSRITEISEEMETEEAVRNIPPD